MNFYGKNVVALTKRAKVREDDGIQLTFGGPRKKCGRVIAGWRADGSNAGAVEVDRAAIVNQVCGDQAQAVGGTGEIKRRPEVESRPRRGNRQGSADRRMERVNRRSVRLKSQQAHSARPG